MVEMNAPRTDGAAAINSPTPPAAPPNQGTPVVEQAREAAGQIMEQARSQVVSQIDTQKERAATGLGSAAQALRQTSQQLREQNQAPIAQLADGAARLVEQVNRYLSERDARQLMREAEQFARDQPALCLGSSFALGFFAARFFKSTAEGAGPIRRSEIASLQPSAYVGTQPTSTWAPMPGATSVGPIDEAMSAPSAVDGEVGTPVAATMGPIGSEVDESEDDSLIPSAGSRSETG